MERFNVGDIVVKDGVMYRVTRPMGKDGKLRLDKSPYRIEAREVRNATKKERAVYFLSETSDEDFENVYTILEYYDAELGKIEQGQDGVPYNRPFYETYLEKKCDNLKTQCNVMYRFLMRLWGQK